MVPIIISHDGAVHIDTVRRWRGIATTSKWSGSGWHRASCATTLSSSGSTSIRAAGYMKRGRRSIPEEFEEEPGSLPERIQNAEERM